MRLGAGALLGVALGLALSAPATAARWDRHRVDDPRATLKRVNALRASFGAPRLVEVPLHEHARRARGAGAGVALRGPAGPSAPARLAGGRRQGGAADGPGMRRAAQRSVQGRRLELRRSRHRLYVYALDVATGGCPALDEVLPHVAVTAKGQALPVAVVPATGCGWIAVTGRPLPRNATVTMDVALAGSTLTHRFSTVVPKTKKKRPKRRGG